MDQGDIAAIDEWIAQIAFVEIHGAVHGRDAHPIAVIANSGDHPTGHDLGMQYAGWQRFVGSIRGREAENVRIADRFRTQARSERITDHAAETGIGTTVWLEGRRMIVGFHFDTGMELLVELNHPRIVTEDADAPVLIASLLTQFAGCGEDGLLEHALELDVACFIDIVHASAERFVGTVFAPGLGDSFQFGVGGVSIQILKMLLDRLHFRQTEVQLTLLAEELQVVVGKLADRHDLQFELVFASDR